MRKGTNFNHPEAGSTIIVEPIRDLAAIAKIRDLLADKPRNLCLFTTGINTNLRIGDLLALKVDQVSRLLPGDSFGIRQKKRKKYGLRTVNTAVYEAIRNWLREHPNPVPDAALFPGKDGVTPLTVPYASRLIKSWCVAVGLRGNFASHSLRKTFGYHSRVTFKMSLPVITAAFNHSSQATTLNYLCIQDSEIKELFMNEL